MSSTGSSYVGLSVQDGVATVRLSDPNDDRFVSESHPMHREVRDLFPRLDDDQSVHAVIWAGHERLFYPLPDLSRLSALLETNACAAARLQLEATQIVRSIISFRKPMIAAVAGPAIGLGAQIAFLSDFLVVARGAYFQENHVRAGLTSGDGATAIWPLVMGLARARRHILRGSRLSAEEADALGLVAELADDPADVMRRSNSLARELAALPSDAFWTTKLALNRWIGLGASASSDFAAALQIATYSSPEFIQSLRAAAADPRPGRYGKEGAEGVDKPGLER
jgi:enoyl-CoA hydratase